jgi:hypothetical protein
MAGAMSLKPSWKRRKYEQPDNNSARRGGLATHLIPSKFIIRRLADW